MLRQGMSGRKMNSELMFSSQSCEWETPQWLFDDLNQEFQFGIDLAATHANKKIPACYSQENCALSQKWINDSGITRGWCNPPYARGVCSDFIAKAAAERENGFLTVMLLPARTDTKAFHRYIYDIGTWKPRDGIEIRFISGRLKFSGSLTAAPFPSMIVIFRPTGN